jgi:branched-chain amino acid transport system substrate-binding protein
LSSRRLFLLLRAILPATLLFAAAALAGGCGGVGVSAAGTVSGNHLTIYSSLPLEGALAPISKQIVDGEKLALAQTGGRVHRFRVYFASLNDANPKTGEWAPGETANNAKYAAQDSTTIAYLGDFNSEATAISLPFINAAGILQVSPASPYVGLTSSLHAGQDEPERFYQTGKRTFARLMPNDEVQAATQVQLMRALGITRVYVVEDQDPFDLPLAAILAEDAKRAGIEVVGEGTIDTTASTEYSEETKKVVGSGAQAVFFSGQPGAGAVALWRELHAADSNLRLLGSSSLSESAMPSSGARASADGAQARAGGTQARAGGTQARAGGAQVSAGSFVGQLGAASGETYLASPVLPSALYPPAARAVLAQYRALFHEAAGPYALVGYEAMSAVLLAIRRAGARGNDRQTVIDKFFAIRNRDSVLGRYSIRTDGDSTLSRYGIDRVVGGRLVFYRAFEVA